MASPLRVWSHAHVEELRFARPDRQHAVADQGSASHGNPTFVIFVKTVRENAPGPWEVGSPTLVRGDVVEVCAGHSPQAGGGHGHSFRIRCHNRFLASASGAPGGT